MSTYTSPISSLIQSALCQLIGLGAGLAIRQSFFINDPTLLAVCIMATHGLVAFVVAHFLKLSVQWKLFNLLVAPVALLYFELHLPDWPLSVALIAAVLLFIPTFWTRVPYYPTSTEMYEAILKELPMNREFSFIDLGSGFGGLLSHIAKNRPMAKIRGFEVSPLAYVISMIRTRSCRKQVSLVFKSFWGENLKDYDFVYAFLAPPPMPKVWEKCRAEMKTGAVLLINSFPVPAKHEKVIDVQDLRGTRLYIYKL